MTTIFDSEIQTIPTSLPFITNVYNINDLFIEFKKDTLTEVEISFAKTTDFKKFYKSLDQSSLIITADSLLTKKINGSYFIVINYVGTLGNDKLKISYR